MSIEGNNNLSPTAQEALQRVRALRTLTARTGFQTTAEQSKVILALNNADLLAVSAELARNKEGVR